MLTKEYREGFVCLGVNLKCQFVKVGKYIVLKKFQDLSFFLKNIFNFKNWLKKITKARNPR